MSDYVLADDLSGALEAGAAFREHGRRVTLHMGESSTGTEGESELILFSSETRNLPGAPAATLLRPLLSRQRKAGAKLLFKKIDSTLRGPVGGELKAIIEELSPPLIVV